MPRNISCSNQTCMKRNHLDEEHLKAIKDWLDEEENSDIENVCPFSSLIEDCPGRYIICAELFPKIMKGTACPCYVYPLNTVIRIAKKAIKEEK